MQGVVFVPPAARWCDVTSGLGLDCREHVPTWSSNGISSAKAARLGSQLSGRCELQDLARIHQRRARAEGIPLKGNFSWSAMDNLGRTNGLGTRFGLAYVDFRTPQRT